MCHAAWPHYNTTNKKSQLLWFWYWFCLFQDWKNINNIANRQSQRVNHSMLVLALQNLANISWLRPTTLLRRADLTNPRTTHVRGAVHVLRNHSYPHAQTSLFHIGTFFLTNMIFQLIDTKRIARHMRNGRKVANLAPASLMEERWSAMTWGVSLATPMTMHVSHYKLGTLSNRPLDSLASSDSHHYWSTPIQFFI